MAIVVKYFGLIAELTQKSEERFVFDHPINSMLLLKLKLESLYPALQKTAYSFALNQTIADEKAILQDSDEVALLPPFSGG